MAWAGSQPHHAPWPHLQTGTNTFISEFCKVPREILTGSAYRYRPRLCRVTAWPDQGKAKPLTTGKPHLISRHLPAQSHRAGMLFSPNTSGTLGLKVHPTLIKAQQRHCHLKVKVTGAQSTSARSSETSQLETVPAATRTHTYRKWLCAFSGYVLGTRL